MRKCTRSSCQGAGLTQAPDKAPESLEFAMVEAAASAQQAPRVPLCGQWHCGKENPTVTSVD